MGDRGARSRRNARLLGVAGFLLAAALPVALWHTTVEQILLAPGFRFEVHYLTGWFPWVLMVAGLAFFVPVAISEGRDPEGRFYPRARNAYLGWGITLYLLGFALAWQVARIVTSIHEA